MPLLHLSPKSAFHPSAWRKAGQATSGESSTSAGTTVSTQAETIAGGASASTRTATAVGDAATTKAETAPKSLADDSGQQSATQPPRTIIYLPGLTVAHDADDALGIARRIERALDRTAKTAGNSYTTVTREVDYGDERKVRVSTIRCKRAAAADQESTSSSGSETNPAGTTEASDASEEGDAVVEVYHFDYRRVLRSRFERQNLAIKFALVLTTTIVAVRKVLPRFLIALAPKQKVPISGRDQWQLVFALGVICCFFAYLGILCFAVWESLNLSWMGDDPAQGATAGVGAEVTDAAQNTDAGTDAETTAAAQAGSSSQDWGVWATIADEVRDLWRLLPFDDLWRDVIYPPLNWLNAQAVIVLTALATILVPRFGRLRDQVGELAIDFITGIHYLQVGERRNVITGHARDLLELALTQRGGRQQDVHVMAYSFGSVVAMDILFPPGSPPNDRMSHVKTLTTIGCPFDLVRTYWPDYFKDRGGLTTVNPNWLNVHSPLDVLSSNFRDDATTTGHPDRGVEVTIRTYQDAFTPENGTSGSQASETPDELPSGTQRTGSSQPAASTSGELVTVDASSPDSHPNGKTRHAAAMSRWGWRRFVSGAPDPSPPSSTDGQSNQAVEAKADTNECQVRKPARNVLFMWGEKQQLDRLDALTMLGLRAHSRYWERQDEAELSAFDEVVECIFADDAWVRG